ncbi:MAG TPA: tRNA (adenine-N1)-methyltransferase [Thermoplasmata archaeon]|nr:tRNA (adenine-N1)-methyltransferase [Thermoplasmata archaeon]
MDERWTEGDVGSLKRPGHPAVLVRIRLGPQRIGDEGVLDLSSQIGAAPGAAIPWSGATYRLVRPSLGDLLASVRRGAQIVTPKDAAELLLLADVVPGGVVAEAGAGSGALTIVLARAVGPAGRVVSYDRRTDFLEVARSNVARTGLEDRVTFRERDVGRDGFDATGFTSLVLDLPEPWAVLPAARSALVAGGSVATYTPTYNQLERTVRALRDSGFDEVRALEVLERALHVSDGGTRPAFEMLGHTGFLAGGRKVDG